MRRTDGDELRATFHGPDEGDGEDDFARTLAVVVTDEGVVLDAYHGEEHVGTKALMADEWFEELTRPRVADYWEEHPRIDDWLYEVTNGDTREGFWVWLEAQHD